MTWFVGLFVGSFQFFPCDALVKSSMLYKFSLNAVPFILILTLISLKISEQVAS